MTDLPESPEAAPVEEETRSAARQVALGLIAFVATLALLFGLATLASNSEPRPRVSGSPSARTAVGSVASASPLSSARFSPSPSRAGDSDPVLVGAGDIADCGLDADSKTADLVASIQGTVFTAGDNAYPDGTRRQFDECYAPTWGRFLDRTRPAAGNHDHNTKDLAGYLAYFGSAASPDGTSWYSYDLGTWHVVVLDSSCRAAGGCGPDSPQGRWLESDLAASKAKCTVAIWHHPRWSSGEHGNDGDLAPFWAGLYDAGADVVVNGHDHDYERFAPQDPAGHEGRERGIREFVVGTGGAALRPFHRVAPNSEVRFSEAHGVIRFTLHDGSYDWAFLATDSSVSDTGTEFCH